MKELGHIEHWKEIPEGYRRHVEALVSWRENHRVMTSRYEDAAGQTHIRKICAACQITWIPGHDDAVAGLPAI